MTIDLGDIPTESPRGLGDGRDTSCLEARGQLRDISDTPFGDSRFGEPISIGDVPDCH